MIGRHTESMAHDPFTAGFSASRDFDFEIRCVIGQAPSGSADVGEVLAAVGSVKPGDHAGWFAAWTALADCVAGIARDAEGAGRRVTAADAWLRASTYYGTAVNAVASLPDEGELLPTFRKHRDAWDRWCDLVELDIERVEIPYEGGTMPGYLLRPAGPAQTRPTLVGVNGSDGSLSAMWSSCAFGALRRGYQVLLFDGPGQQSMLFERDVPFRPDWEAVLTPVIDWLVGQAATDPAAIAVYGISQGGYWVTRALAFEHRPAAAVVDPGVVDVSASWTAQIPKHLLGLLDAGKDAEFDRDMALGMRLAKDAAHTWRFRARPFGADGYAAVLHAVEAYRADDVAARITTPLLITDPEDEQFWPGQSERLHTLAPAVSELARFTAAEGANQHCEPLARSLADARIFDWLDARLGR